MLPNLSSLSVDAPTSAPATAPGKRMAPPLKELPQDLLQKVLNATLFRSDPRAVCADVAALLQSSKSVNETMTEQLFERLCVHFHWASVLSAYQNVAAYEGRLQAIETYKKWFLRVCGARRKLHDEVVRRLGNDRYLRDGATYSPETGWPLLDEYFVGSDRPLAGLFEALTSELAPDSLDWLAVTIAQATYRLGENTGVTAMLIADLANAINLSSALAHAAVKTNGMSLEYVGDFRYNRDVILGAVRQDGYAIVHAPIFFGQESDFEFVKEVVMEAVKQNGLVWSELNSHLPQLRSYEPDWPWEPWVRDLAFAAVRQNAKSFESMYPTELTDDRELVELVVKTKPGLIVRCTDWNLKRRLMGDKAFALRAMLDDDRSVSIAPDAFRDDACMMTEVLLSHPMALEDVSARLQDTDHVVLAAVLGNAYALQYASTRLKNEPDIVIRAAESDPEALLHASKNLRANRSFMLRVMELRDGGRALQYASESLRDDAFFVRAAILTSPERAFEEASARLRNDLAIVKLAIESTDHTPYTISSVLRAMGDEMLASVELFRFVFEMSVFGNPQYLLDRWLAPPLIWYFETTKRGRDLAHVNEGMRDDFDVVLAAVKADGLALQSASWRLRGNLEIASAATTQNAEARRFVRA